MSTSHNNTLYLRPYEEIELHTPECGVRVLPGRLAALSHPLNKGRTILLPDRETYDPDLATVVSSGISIFKPNQAVILAPDHGAYYPQLSPDKREMRIVGVACPWWDSVLATYDENGIHPAPGWMLVEIERQRHHPELVEGPDGAVAPSTATVLASHGDHHTQPYKNQHVCIDGLRTYHLSLSSIPDASCRNRGGGLALVQAPIASKKWLLSLQT